MQTIHELSAELLPKEEDKEQKVEDEYDLQEPSDAHPYKGRRTRRKGGGMKTTKIKTSCCLSLRRMMKKDANDKLLCR